MSERMLKKVAVWLENAVVWPVLLWRWCNVGYTYRRIYLGEGIWTILEQADYYRLRKYKWVAHASGRGGENLYAIRHKLISPRKTKMVYMHREIMNPIDERLVDHWNCESLDNRGANLRFATRSQNMQNRRKKKKTSSQFIGVHFKKSIKKWIARITYEGKRWYLGEFENEIDAARAYDEAAKEHHGAFARLNFPPPGVEERALFARIGKSWDALKGVARRSWLVSRESRGTSHETQEAG